MKKEYFDRIFEAVDERAKGCGAQFDMYYSGGSNLSAETFRDELAAFSAGTEGSLIVRVTVNGKTGSAQSTIATIEEAVLLFDKAVENAALIEKSEQTLYCPGGLSYEKKEEIPFTMPGAAEIKEIAMKCRDAAYASSEEISDGTAGGAYAGCSETYLYSSEGLRLQNAFGYSGAYVYSVLERGEDKRDGMKSEHDLSKLCFEELAREAKEKAEEKFGAGLVKSGRYPIVFEGRQMQQILSTFCACFFAREAQLGTSLLKDKEGEVIATDKLTLIDDPFYPGNAMQVSFDGEGYPTARKTVIDKGVLKTLLYNLESGAKAGKSSTGNGSRGSAAIGTRVYNFYIVPGEHSREELFKLAEGGIFVTQMKGFHAGANAVSGDFSIESEGFMIKDGKKGAPVKSFTVSGNFFDLLKDIAAIGDTIEDTAPAVSKIRCPDIYLPSLSVAGI
ncbi:MAG: TldD/PmbA family protein [Clostridia bacterium]|nr:TldD/PmbA family protein [Clostridia bacterium]